MQPDDDEVWRTIVDNYGDRIDLGPEDSRAPWVVEPTAEPAEPSADPVAPERTWVSPDDDWSTDRFVPPPPPPVPATTSDRAIAWTALFGAPVVLMLSLVLGLGLYEWVDLLLVTAFAGGFIYLVVKMPREPRDPDDDGAVL